MKFAEAAEELEEKVRSGDYPLTDLADCGADIVGDRYPQLVRFQEITLFANPKPPFGVRPQLLILQPQALLEGKETSALQERFRKGLDERFEAATKERKKEDPSSVDRALRNVMRSAAKFVGAKVHFTPLGGGPLKPSDAADFVEGVFFPGSYGSADDIHPLVGLCATYEQTWHALGHTRGELLSSLGLAPGERVTLEVHTWDKSSRKSEEELAVESEMRTAEKMTQRDALTVAQEHSKQVNSKVDASATVPIPKMPISVSGSVSTEVRDSLKSTQESIKERTVEASSSLKLNRKTRVEVSREVGREEKQSRVIENTNRCHTLNCQYFELIANYRVATRLVSVRPCVLIRNPRPSFTLDWVLCHEDILVEALLDRLYLAGFAAAKTLKTQDIIIQLQTEAALAKLADISQRLLPVINPVLDSYRVLRDAYDEAKSLVQLCGGDLGCVFDELSDLTAERVVTWLSLLDSHRSALERLDQDIMSGQSPAEATVAFLSVLGPERLKERKSENATQQAWEDLYEIDLWFDIIDDILSKDDAGLTAAVDALSSFAASAITEGTEDQPAERAHPEFADLAEAQVEFERLLCHLSANLLHYCQAVWASEGREDRFLRLQGLGTIATAIDNELLGFYADRAAYPLRRTDAVTNVDLADIVKKVTEDIEAQKPEPVLVSMPTDGLLLEAAIGECDACEEYIQQSRVLDLRMQKAKAKQEEAEAERREARVSQGDLSDPDPSPGKLVVEVQGLSGETGGE